MHKILPYGLNGWTILNKKSREARLRQRSSMNEQREGPINSATKGKKTLFKIKYLSKRSYKQ